jgi:uncharacterized protein
VIETRALRASYYVVVRSCAKELIDQELLIPRLGSARLKMALAPMLWKDKDHIGIKQLWEYFCFYIYLPRLKDRDALLRAIQDGISTVVSPTEFAYAEAYDEQTGRYVGLRMGGGRSVVMDSSSVLVKPEVAHAQIEEDDRQRTETGDDTGLPSGASPTALRETATQGSQSRLLAPR